MFSFVDDLTVEEQQKVKNRVAQLLSELLSAQYDCKATVRFVPKEEENNEHHSN